MARRRTPLPAPVYPPANSPVSRTLDAGYQRTMAGDDVRVSAAITAITSVTDLRASVLHLDQASVRLLGYYTTGDGGGGDLYWDANSTADDDGGVFFKPDSVMEAGRWRRDLSDGT